VVVTDLIEKFETQCSCPVGRRRWIPCGGGVERGRIARLEESTSLAVGGGVSGCGRGLKQEGWNRRLGNARPLARGRPTTTRSRALQSVLQFFP